MNILSREDLRNQIKKREFAPVYLLFGAETYLRDLAAKTITDMVLADSGLREFNETEFSQVADGQRGKAERQADADDRGAARRENYRRDSFGDRHER